MFDQMYNKKHSSDALVMTQKCQPLKNVLYINDETNNIILYYMPEINLY